MADIPLILRDGLHVARNTPVVILCDEKAYNADGGTFTAGAWRHRDANLVIFGSAYVALASNRFTPIEGKWWAQWWAPSYFVGSHISRLYNYTTSTQVALGSAGYNSSAGVSESFGGAVLTANGTDAFQIEHQCGTTRATNGFGVQTGISGINSRFTFVTLTRL